MQSKRRKKPTQMSILQYTTDKRVEPNFDSHSPNSSKEAQMRRALKASLLDFKPVDQNQEQIEQDEFDDSDVEQLQDEGLLGLLSYSLGAS
jgi:hypothetical protein